MTFSNPALLTLAAILVALCFFGYRALERRKTSQALAYTNIAFLREAMRAPQWPARLVLSALVVGAALLGSAAAGPHLIARVPAKDGSVVLCIDTSGSMTATDVLPTRADAAKAAARAFVGEVPQGTKLAIVAFSSGADLVQGLTSDRQQINDAIDRIPLPNGATAIGDALSLAAQQLPERGHRVVVLITDGVNNRGVDPLEVAKFLASRHVPVYTIGIGTNDSGEVIPGTNEPATIDEDALRAIAQAGGGAYARATDAAQLRNALSHLGQTTILEKKKIDASLPFALAGGLLMIATLLGGLAFGRFP